MACDIPHLHPYIWMVRGAARQHVGAKFTTVFDIA